MLTIPQSTLYVVKQGASGIPAFAVQRICNKLGFPVAEDFAWGPKTTVAVKRVQRLLSVGDDGILGPTTQGRLAKYLCARQEDASNLPRALLQSKITYESGGYITAVNWSVAGGVDCGMTQRRVFDEDYGNDSVVKRAFDAVYQVDLSGDRARELFDIFRSRAGIKGNIELAWRVSILNHNYPSLADAISRYGINGLSTYYRSPQTWVSSFGLKFPDGALIRTPLEWGQRYALGSIAHDEPGQAVRLVREWTS